MINYGQLPASCTHWLTVTTSTKSRDKYGIKYEDELDYRIIQ